MTDIELVGLTGFAGSGKDTVAEILVVDHGFVRFALADAVRAALLALDPWVITDYQVDRLSNVVDDIGWDGAKRNSPEIRRLLQRMGTEVGRNMFGENVWTDRFRDWARAEPAGTKAVITDVRFDNEVALVDGLRGTLWHVDRPGVGPVNGHVSDAGLPRRPQDVVLGNDTSIDDLRDVVAAALMLTRASTP